MADLVFNSLGPNIDIAGTLDGAQTTDQLMKLAIHPSYRNGSNGVRGDSIAKDDANYGGHSSYSPLWLHTGAFGDKGSVQLITAQFSNEQPAGGGDAYNECLALYLNGIANRRGALTETIEAGLTVNQPSRSQVAQFILSDNVPRANYGLVMGATSAWARTGARILSLISMGSQPATGVYVQGTASPVIDYAPSVAGSILFRHQLRDEPLPRTQLLGDRLQFGTGKSTLDTTIFRAAARVMGVNAALELREYEPSNGPAGSARLFARKNAAGKTELAVKFSTGAAVVLATQP